MTKGEDIYIYIYKMTQHELVQHCLDLSDNDLVSDSKKPHFICLLQAGRFAIYSVIPDIEKVNQSPVEFGPM